MKIITQITNYDFISLNINCYLLFFIYHTLLFVLYCLVIRLWILMYFRVIFKIKNIACIDV